MEINKILSQEFKLRQEQIDNTIELIDEGMTIPFIARYRKERTGSLDDQVLREIFDRLNYLRNLEKRKEEVKNLIDSQGKLDDELIKKIFESKTLVEIEDIYRPFKPKRKTKASIARERGLEALAKILMEQNLNVDPIKESENFVSEEKEVLSSEAALQGAMDIIAEDISDDAELRKSLRMYYKKNGTIHSKVTDESLDKDSIYLNYYDFAESIIKSAHHRILAMDRGEKENILKVSITSADDMPKNLVSSKYANGNSLSTQYIQMAAEDSFKRLIFPSIEREIRAELTEAAAEQAIKVFAENLRQLLLQPPVKNNITLGLDPGYRTG